MDRKRPAQPSSQTELGRRAFLSGLAGSLLVGVGFEAAAARGSAGPLYVGCRADDAERHFATGFRADGRMVFDVPLAGRGHGAAFRPAPAHCVVFARRPGTFAVVIDIERGEALCRIDAAGGRHFYGHGAFSPDGRHLFTSENDFEAGRGVIGIRDAGDGYRQIGEVASHGVGPHEVTLMPDGATLAVANGGIRTHPDMDRAKLNLDTMQPSLAYLDLASGRLQDAFGLAPDLHRLSIRHLTVNRDGLVAMAMQYEGSKRDRVPLVGLHDGGAIRLLEAPAAIERRMRHYAGSIAFDQGGRLLAVSCPRGSLITFWDAETGRLVDDVEVPDGCGVAAADAPGKFVITGGRGDVLSVEPGRGKRAPVVVAGQTATAWDNHLARAPVQRGQLASSPPSTFKSSKGYQELEKL
ncbi:MAG: DUF1513 domain-containing protein [Geminicoccaceae bacterium]